MNILSFISSKIFEILCNGLRGVALTKQNGFTDCLTGQKHKLVAWGIINEWINMWTLKRQQCKVDTFK